MLPLSDHRGPSRQTKTVILIAVCIAGYFVYLRGIDKNPPGFYLDEASASYNAYTIKERGEGEFGHFLPLYFPIFPLAPPFDYLGYAEPVQIYLLAGLYFIFSPSVIVSRGLSATSMFLMALLLGWIAAKFAKRLSVGIVVAGMVLATPWFFEMGRLAFSASLYPLTVALLLVALFRVSRKESWSILDIGFICLSLALTTYTYAIGRLLGPLFALGLVLFLTNKKQIIRVLATWSLYALTLVPMLVFHLRNPKALTGRLNMSVGYISADKSYGEIFSEFLAHYWANIYPKTLLFTGDLNLRHHIGNTPPILAATFVLSIAGVAAVCIRYWRDAWWRFILFGLVVSIVPASLTKNDFHMLRLSPFAVFLTVLTIPALVWLLSGTFRDSPDLPQEASRFRWFRIASACVLLVSSLIGTWSFFSRFNEVGPTRGGYFDGNFPAAFAAAIERPERPIYLPDQYYYQAFWQAIVQDIDRSNFVRLAPMQRPPANSLVLSGEEKCSDCEMILKDIPFVVYKTRNGPSTQSMNSSMLLRPRGVAVDKAGNYFVTDTGNIRIVKFDAEGNFVTAFGTPGDGAGLLREPHGIAVNDAGNIYVTDSARHVLLRYKPDGSFEREWVGPDLGFYGPRDLAVAKNGQVYIVDQGRTRITVFDPADESFSAWGSGGTGAGQFSDPTGIAVAGSSVFVADMGNRRVQVFNLTGTFQRLIPVQQWGPGVNFPDVAVDEISETTYITSPPTGEVLVFDKKGSLVRSLKPNSINGQTSLTAISIAIDGKSLLVTSTTQENPIVRISLSETGNR